MKLILLILLVFGTSQAWSKIGAWETISKSEQAEILSDLAYLSEDELPEGSKVLDFLKVESAHGHFTDYKDLALSNFDSELSREAIEQSPYQSFGDEELVSFYILVDSNHKILGSYAYLYQEGRDEDGNEGDISWSAYMTFDHNADFFRDEDGELVDELRFEWSGH